MRKTYSGMGGQFKVKLKGSPKTKRKQAEAALKSFKQKLKKGKVYTLVEELGAVQRRGVDLGQTKRGKRVKTKLLPKRVKKFKGGLMVKPKAAKRGY